MISKKQRQDEQHQDEGVNDGEPVDVHVLMPVRHRGLQLQLQGLRRGDVRQVREVHRVRKLDRHARLPVRNVDQVLQVQVASDVRRHHFLLIVADDVVQVIHKEVPVLRLAAGVLVDGGLDAERTVDGQFADEELEHVVRIDRGLEQKHVLL